MVGESLYRKLSKVSTSEGGKFGAMGIKKNILVLPERMNTN